MISMHLVWVAAYLCGEHVTYTSLIGVCETLDWVVEPSLIVDRGKWVVVVLYGL